MRWIFMALIMVSAEVCAEEESRILTPRDLVAIGTNKWVQYVLKDIYIGGEKVDLSRYDDENELIKKYGFERTQEIKAEQYKEWEREYKIKLRKPNPYTGQRAGIVALHDEEIPKQNRSIKECIKPDNVIDDDVLKCTRWEIDKSW